MTDAMLAMYVRNQIMIDPTHMGEEIVVNGERIDTRKMAAKEQEGSKFVRGNGLVELYMTFIRNCDDITINVKSKQIPLSELMSSFKFTLPQKDQLDLIVDKFMPYIEEYVRTHVCSGNGYVLDDALAIPKYDMEMCNTAVKHLLGSSNSRFIYTLANKTTNGNVLDLYADEINRFNSAKGGFISYASGVRAFGYPYTNYKTFISKDMLVSTDLAGLVYVTYDDVLYCIKASDFISVASDGIKAMPLCKRVYNTRDISVYTNASIGGLR